MITFNTPPPKKSSSSRQPSTSFRDPSVQNFKTPPPKQSPSTALRDPSVGQSKILFNMTYRTAICSCGKDSCKELTKIYQAIFDLRGHYQQIPTITPGSRKQNIQDKLKKKLERIKTHLDLGPEFKGSILITGIKKHINRLKPSWKRRLGNSNSLLYIISIQSFSVNLDIQLIQSQVASFGTMRYGTMGTPKLTSVCYKGSILFCSQLQTWSRIKWFG